MANRIFEQNITNDPLRRLLEALRTTTGASIAPDFQGLNPRLELGSPGVESMRMAPGGRMSPAAAIPGGMTSGMPGAMTQPQQQLQPATIPTPQPDPSTTAISTVMSDPKTVEKILQQLEKDTFNTKPIGPDLMQTITGQPGQGGFFGIGIQPTDVLGFALMALLTRNMPTNQAIQTTLQGALLPAKFRQQQRENLHGMLSSIMNVTQTATGQQQAATNQQTAQLNQLKAVADLQQEQQQQQALSGFMQSVGNLATGQSIADLPATQRILGVVSGVLPATALSDPTKLTVDKERGLIIDTLKGTATPIIGPSGEPLGPQTRGQELSQRTREIIASNREQGREISIAQARQQAQQEQIQLRRAQGAAGFESRGTVPLALLPKGRGTIINRNTLTEQLGSTFNEARSNPNLAVVDNESMKFVRELRNLKAVAGSTARMANRLIKAKDITGVLQQRGSALFGRHIASTEFSILEDFNKNLGALAVRAFGDTGRLSDFDIERGSSIMPNPKDTAGIAALKINYLNELTDSLIRAQIDGLSPSQTRQLWNQQIDAAQRHILSSGGQLSPRRSAESFMGTKEYQRMGKTLGEFGSQETSKDENF